VLARCVINQRTYPQYVKYMGSKSKIMDFVLSGINEVHTEGTLCDLFAGSATISGALGGEATIHSNDIQEYSSVLASAYLARWEPSLGPSLDDILSRAHSLVRGSLKQLKPLHDYNEPVSLTDFNNVEKQQRMLIDRSFRRSWHLFLRYYAGTWWSAEQAAWIDAFRQVAEEYRTSPVYSGILASLMYAMAYSSQGTGHYAQYRDANTESSMRDISIYRRRSVAGLFSKKFNETCDFYQRSSTVSDHKITALDYRECLKKVRGGTVYADPPYAFVHYSRFYHALETLVKYDYPNIQKKAGIVVKGRYREDRHQSPFCIRSQVATAFGELFGGVKKARANLVLSYSKNGMISLDNLCQLAIDQFGRKAIDVMTIDHKHMTLGRQFDRDRDVQECLVLIKQ